MHVRSARMIDLPPISEIHEHIEWALDNGEPVRVGDLLLVSDVLRFEVEANGTVLPDTIAAQSEDGRQVFVYDVVDGLGYPLRPA